MKKLLTIKNMLYAVLAGLMAMLIVSIGPFDVFVHGFYVDAPQFTQSSAYLNLKTNPLEQRFVPKNDHFKGVELLFSNISDADTGTIAVQLKTDKGVLLENKRINADEISRDTWTPVIFRTALQKGTPYVLSLNAENYSGTPVVFFVDAFVGDTENISCQDVQGTAFSGNLLVGYGYGKPTFTFSEKAMLIALLLCLFIMFTARIYGKANPKVQKHVYKASLMALLCVIMTWNFTFCSFDNANNSFSTFQDDSESLVTSVIRAQHEELPLTPYGLGRYENLFGTMKTAANFAGKSPELLNDTVYTNGYAILWPGIAIPNNEFAFENVQVGGSVLFADGTQCTIAEVTNDGAMLKIDLACDELLNSAVQGSLADIQVFLPDKHPMSTGVLSAYNSQFGLQGEVFRRLSSGISYTEVLPGLHFLCAFLTAAVLTLICFLVYKKYNMLLSVCFYVTFLLSPWVVNFAKNLYWVEFTWFLPMLVGLLCACFIRNRAVRIFCYFGAFATIFIKSLCGYEYITTIMLGMISFLVIDFVVACTQKKSTVVTAPLKDKAKNPFLIARTIFIIGCAALVGFALAICIHASLRGAGDMLAGIDSIIKQDVLRRTVGGQISDFEPGLWESLNASTWETINKYFRFDTEILTGIPGNLFPLFALAPLAILVWNYVKKKSNPAQTAAYFMFLAASISWFVLAKSHSYVHTHMNYVLWYFGFIQICLYIPLSQFKNWLKPPATSADSQQ